MILRAAAIAVLLAVPAAAAPQDPWRAANLESRLGAQVPLDTDFRDEAGRPLLLGDLLGGPPVILAPVYYRCPNICGLTLSGLFDALAGSNLVPGREFKVIAFSIDPRETPAVAADVKRQYADRYPRLIDGVTLLTGDEHASTTVAAAMGFGYAWDDRVDEYAHASAVAVLTPAGTVARYVRGLDADPGDLRLAVVESSAGRLGGFVDKVRLLCFGYDPTTGRYTTSVIAASRIMGTVTVLALAALIAGWWWRERRTRDVPMAPR